MKNLLIAFAGVIFLGMAFAVGYLLNAPVEERGNGRGDRVDALELKTGELDLAINDHNTEIEALKKKNQLLDMKLRKIERDYRKLRKDLSDGKVAAGRNRPDSSVTTTDADLEKRMRKVMEEERKKRLDKMRDNLEGRAVSISPVNMGKKRLEIIKKDLELTDAQAESLSEIWDEFAKKRSELMKEHMKTVFEEMEDEDGNKKRMSARFLGGEEFMQKQKELNREELDEIARVLGPDQFEQYKKKYNSPGGGLSPITIELKNGVNLTPNRGGGNDDDQEDRAPGGLEKK